MSSRTLSIRYVGDPRGALGALKQIETGHASFGQKMRLLGGQISTVGRKMALGLTVPLLGLFKQADAEFSEFQNVNAQTAAAIESTGGAAGVTKEEIQELSAAIGELSARDAEEVQAMENVLLTFVNLRNEVGKGNDIFNQASLAVADMAARLGTDLQSSAIQVGKALQDPTIGLTALRRVGVSFTKAQTEQILKWHEQGDTLRAQKAILKELNKEFAGSAKAAGKSVSSWDRLKLSFNELAEGLGRGLKPVLMTIGEFVGNLAAKFKGLSPEVQKVITVVLLIVAALGPVVFIVGKVVSAIGVLISAFGGIIKVLGVLRVAFVANPFLLIVAAVVAVAAIIIANWTKIKDFLVKVWNGIKAAAAAVWNAIKDYIMVVLGPVALIIAHWGKVKGFLIAVWNTIRNAAKAAWNAVKDAVMSVVGPIVNAIKTIIGWIKAAIEWLGKLAEANTGAKLNVPGMGGPPSGPGPSFRGFSAPTPGKPTVGAPASITVHVDARGSVAVSDRARQEFAEKIGRDVAAVLARLQAGTIAPITGTPLGA